MKPFGMVTTACGFTFTQISEFPGLATDDGAGVVELAKALTGANRISKVSFGTEAGLSRFVIERGNACG